jgi:hypothetical protein
LNVCLSFVAIGSSRENHFRLVRSVRRFCRSRVLQWEQERSPVDWPRIKCIKTEKAGAIGDAPAPIDPAIYLLSFTMRGSSAADANSRRARVAGEKTMRVRTQALAAVVASTAIVTVALFLESLTTSSAQTPTRYLPEYTASGDLVLPKNFHEWVYVGSPLTPNALNGGQAGFPEFHNVYIEPGSYEIYKKTHEFPEGTIFFKELQLTLGPSENPDGSRTEPSGRGYFPGPWNGADVTVKDSRRFADTNGWGYFNFNHHEPKAPTAKVKAKSECAFCHIASAKKDEVWTQFYPLLDIGMPQIK